MDDKTNFAEGKLDPKYRQNVNRITIELFMRKFMNLSLLDI